MKKHLYAVLSLLFMASAAQSQHNVTFQVDMNQLPINQRIYLVGSFQTPNAWSLGPDTLTNTTGSIYSKTVPITGTPGSVVEYKFVNGSDWTQQENLGAPCAYPGTNNRFFRIPTGDTTLGATCFQSCGACAAITVTFKVDMAGATVQTGGVHLIGDFQTWDPMSAPMASAGGTMYSYTRTFLPNQYIQYKTLNGDNWTSGVQEVVVGGCTIGTNRFLVVPGHDTTITYKWGYCNAAGTISGLRTACIGTSITYGTGVNNPATQSFPARLRPLLGTGYTIDNFGHSGATLTKHGDSPYWKMPGMTNLMLLAPQVAIIELGTNDSKSFNWNVTAADFVANYMSLIDTLRMARPNVDIYACLPAQAFTPAFDISETNLQAIRPMILEAARLRGVSVIDVFDTTNKAFVTIDYQNYFPDGVHPGAAGVDLIATKIAHMVSYPKKPVTQVVDTLTAPAAMGYQWYRDGQYLLNDTNQTLVIQANGVYTCATLLNHTRNDWAMTLPITATTTAVASRIENTFRIYPNPADNELSISGLTSRQESQVKLFDQLGRSKAFSWNANKRIDISRLAPGLYWVRVGQSKPVSFIKK